MHIIRRSKIKEILLEKNILWAAALAFTIICIFYLYQANTALQQVNTALEQRNAQLEAEIATLRDAQEYEVRKMNVTKYAPLDPQAVEGWDYAGDREVTASGEKVVIGGTAAAGPNIPFGTRIYVEGKGWYTVKDRGGKIGVDDIDLAAACKEETQAWGVQQRLVIIEKP